ncbi:MAG: hypothetical protein ACI83H_002911 [Glaciecola sp.]|jgi:hypothetical protein
MFKTNSIKLYLLLTFALILCNSTFSQKRIYLNQNYCATNGDSIHGLVYSFNSSQEAEKIIFNIVDLVGLKANFIVQAANVPNALATHIEKQRVILYNEVWIQQLKEKSKTDWSATFVLAHEIGHHLNGHLITVGESRPDIELEADQFAGFVLFKLGAKLNETLAAVQQLNINGTRTHPPRVAREQAVIVGWTKGKNQNSENQKSSTNGSNMPDKPKLEKPRTSDRVGSLCILNPNHYSRKIVLIQSMTSKVFEIIVGQAPYGETTEGCIYDIPIGIYECQVYTTLNQSLTEKFNIRINEGKELKKNITKDHRN